MTPNTNQKLSHLLGYPNSCCCPVRSDQLMTILNLRLAITGAGLKYPRHYFPLRCLIFLDYANLGVQDDNVLIQHVSLQSQ